jgi:FADH2 O2-dependent halogenase
MLSHAGRDWHFEGGRTAMAIRFDIAILGSGFGGSLLASILRRQGYTVAVVDQATHPRFAIGESSTPAADLIFRDLCQRYDLAGLVPLTRYGTWKEAFPAVNCGRKRGFSYFHHQANGAFTTDAANQNQLLVAASSDDVHCDMHWYRADTDALLANYAQEQGVEFFVGKPVESVVKHDWRIVIPQAQHEEIQADFFIDASGSSRTLTSCLGACDVSEQLRTRSRAIYSHLVGLDSWDAFLQRTGGNRLHPFDCDAAAQHHLLEEGWLWMLRFDDGTTSVGLCLDESLGSDCLAVSTIVERYPDLSSLFRASQLSDSPGRWIATGRLQRLVDRAAGPDWAALPHSVGFVDPLHSTGIGLTMSSIEQLAQALDPGIDLRMRAQRLSAYNRELHAAFLWIDELVSICYQTRHVPALFHACVMLYFTATVHFEQSRSAGVSSQFLSTDWQPIRDAVRFAQSMLEPFPDSSARQSHVADQILTTIGPLSNVGLAHPAALRMYRHTACEI